MLRCWIAKEPLVIVIIIIIIISIISPTNKNVMVSSNPTDIYHNNLQVSSFKSNDTNVCNVDCNFQFTEADCKSPKNANAQKNCIWCSELQYCRYPFQTKGACSTSCGELSPQPSLCNISQSCVYDHSVQRCLTKSIGAILNSSTSCINITNEHDCRASQACDYCPTLGYCRSIGDFQCFTNCSQLSSSASPTRQVACGHVSPTKCQVCGNSGLCIPVVKKNDEETSCTIQQNTCSLYPASNISAIPNNNKSPFQSCNIADECSYCPDLGYCNSVATPSSACKTSCITLSSDPTQCNRTAMCSYCNALEYCTSKKQQQSHNELPEFSSTSTGGVNYFNNDAATTIDDTSICHQRCIDITNPSICVSSGKCKYCSGDHQNSGSSSSSSGGSSIFPLGLCIDLNQDCADCLSANDQDICSNETVAPSCAWCSKLSYCANSVGPDIINNNANSVCAQTCEALGSSGSTAACQISPACTQCTLGCVSSSWTPSIGDCPKTCESTPVDRCSNFSSCQLCDEFPSIKSCASTTTTASGSNCPSHCYDIGKDLDQSAERKTRCDAAAPYCRYCDDLGGYCFDATNASTCPQTCTFLGSGACPSASSCRLCDAVGLCATNDTQDVNVSTTTTTTSIATTSITTMNSASADEFDHHQSPSISTALQQCPSTCQAVGIENCEYASSCDSCDAVGLCSSKTYIAAAGTCPSSCSMIAQQDLCKSATKCRWTGTFCSSTSCFSFLLPSFNALPYLLFGTGLVKDVLILIALGYFGDSVLCFVLRNVAVIKAWFVAKMCCCCFGCCGVLGNIWKRITSLCNSDEEEKSRSWLENEEFVKELEQKLPPSKHMSTPSPKAICAECFCASCCCCCCCRAADMSSVDSERGKHQQLEETASTTAILPFFPLLYTEEGETDRHYFPRGFDEYSLRLTRWLLKDSASPQNSPQIQLMKVAVTFVLFDESIWIDLSGGLENSDQNTAGFPRRRAFTVYSPNSSSTSTATLLKEVSVSDLTANLSKYIKGHVPSSRVIPVCYSTSSHNALRLYLSLRDFPGTASLVLYTLGAFILIFSTVRFVLAQDGLDSDERYLVIGFRLMNSSTIGTVSLLLVKYLKFAKPILLARWSWLKVKFDRVVNSTKNYDEESGIIPDWVGYYDILMKDRNGRALSGADASNFVRLHQSSVHYLCLFYWCLSLPFVLFSIAGVVMYCWYFSLLGVCGYLLIWLFKRLSRRVNSKLDESNRVNKKEFHPNNNSNDTSSLLSANNEMNYYHHSTDGSSPMPESEPTATVLARHFYGSSINSNNNNSDNNRVSAIDERNYGTTTTTTTRHTPREESYAHDGDFHDDDGRSNMASTLLRQKKKSDEGKGEKTNSQCCSKLTFVEYCVGVVYFLTTQALPTLFIVIILQAAYNYGLLTVYSKVYNVTYLSVISTEYHSRTTTCLIKTLENDLSEFEKDISHALQLLASVIPFM